MRSFVTNKAFLILFLLGVEKSLERIEHNGHVVTVLLIVDSSTFSN